jgi:pyruvate formate lyase activating enzyme
MSECKICGKKSEVISFLLQVCKDCICNDSKSSLPYIIRAHKKARHLLPHSPPREDGGVCCELCSNKCKIPPLGISFCGLKKNIDGELKPLYDGEAVAYYYLDPIPTNCCASWFCGEREGYNLAFFFYGCGYNCLFCQNSSHKNIREGKEVSVGEVIDLIKRNQNISCICFFGGSPEPQLPFAIKLSHKILELPRKIRICWEWNGSGHPNLVKEVARISALSRGIIKFDLKAFTPSLSLALSGVENRRAYENFILVYQELGEDFLLTATTCLVSGYVDKFEVEGIANFLASLNPRIPYSLLVFHPDFYMRDLPITPLGQVEECFEVAKKHLKFVNIGNKHLLY